MNLIYDERGGMVAVYEAKRQLDCLELPADSFVFLRHFKRDTNGDFVRDDAACAMAQLIASAPLMLEAVKKHLKESGCDGDLCAFGWHEDFLKLIRSVEPDYCLR